MVHILCVLDKYGYGHTFIEFNSYCFPTSTMVKRTLLNITLHVHCESCFMYSLQATHTEAKKKKTEFTQGLLPSDRQDIFLNIGSLKVIYRIKTPGYTLYCTKLSTGLHASLQKTQLSDILVLKFNQCVSHLLLKTSSEIEV